MPALTSRADRTSYFIPLTYYSSRHTGSGDKRVTAQVSTRDVGSGPCDLDRLASAIEQDGLCMLSVYGCLQHLTRMRKLFSHQPNRNLEQCAGKLRRCCRK